ncbi:MAG: hypothetical protein ACI9GH_000266 [Candidatus Paceibacteria bacterium]|jgi:hypothetical protein
MCTPVGEYYITGDIAMAPHSRGALSDISERIIDRKAESLFDLPDGCLHVRPVETGWNFTGASRPKDDRIQCADSTEEYRKRFKEATVELLPKEIYSSEASIDVTDIFIRIVDLHEETAIIIENPRLAKTFKTIFKLASIGIEQEKKDIKDK